ncbi:uncharacterized protein LOC130814659 isoform X2 [Amaranthus tricolor]|nr:uncharacterized protein LOC130814659 isoform X2 [Amaranthus tricolor]XP_057536804.1 uncharacterized protein LOC130814659 isoform X2 [Amaranthus tricolor]
MKKLFFPYSSSNGGQQHEKSPTKKERKQSPQTRWKTVGLGKSEKTFHSNEQLIPACEKKVTEKKTILRTRSLVYRRSQSFQVSSAADNGGRVDEKDRTRLRGSKNGPSSHSRCDCRNFDLATIQLPHAEVLRDHFCSCPSNSSSPQSSFGSTSVSGKVLDLYVDGEHRKEMKLGISDRYPRGANEGNYIICPSDDASRDHSLKFENEIESPRKLAKNVIDRLLRIEHFYDSKKDGDDILDKHLDGKSSTPKANISTEESPLEDILDKHLDGKISTEEQTDLTLKRKLEEVKERSRLLSVQLAEGRFLQYIGDRSTLCQAVRNLIEEKRNLVVEVYEQLTSRITERVAAKEIESLLKREMNSTILKLEKEKEEVQSRLQNELDRRSDEWEIKLREFQSEDNRLRDRVKDLAEQNVCLQREISGFYNKEDEYTNKLSNLEVLVEDLTAKMDITKLENEALQKKLSDIQDKLKLAEDIQSTMERKRKEKETEYMELIKVVAKLRGTCTEQERTIDGLRHSLNSENLTNKLQIEQLRLTGVEQDLRKQLESYSVETNSLRSENIYLLERLRSVGEVSGSLGFKLDRELEARVKCLQNAGVSLLNECIQMCENLLGIVERKTTPESFIDTHSLVQYGMKIQGFKKGLEQLTISIGKTSSILKEKAELNSEGTNKKVQKDDMGSELQAERLLTSILKEKLYSKEKEVEHIQAELARALRSDDVLKKEIQNAADTVSCVNHKMKNLELQMIKKDGTIIELQGDIRLYDEELTKTLGVLSKVTQERDLMWQEVKEYSEKNMLLNREVESLKKKIEALEEDTLFKDGHISILKESLNKAKSYDILFDSEQANEF